jgi:hypothetical protein
MKTSRWRLMALAVAVTLQLAVPASMIVWRERTLREGEAFKFRTRPLNPYDAFRGGYVALQFEQNQAALPPGVTVERGQRLYVPLETDKDGFARFGTASLAPPASGPYLKLHAWHVTGTNSVSLEPPFNRFYMEKKLAPAAEQAYREHGRRGQQDAYVTLRVRDGFAVIENLYVGGKPITEFVREAKR